MAPKQLAAADAAQALVVPERDELPEFGPLRQALEELRVGGFASQEEFVLACSRLRAAFEKIGANPDNAKLRRLRRTHPVVASEILAVSGIEEALLDIGWTIDDAGEGALVFHGDASALRAAASQVGEVEAWVRRRDVQLAMAIRDPEGKSSELHHPMVLQGEPKFKGAVWHMSHPSCRPDGVVVFHNSPLSNYSEAGARLSHEGQEFSFSTSEAIIMAFKQHLLLQIPLKESLGAMTAARSGGEAKAIVARAIRNATEIGRSVNGGRATACMCSWAPALACRSSPKTGA